MRFISQNKISKNPSIDFYSIRDILKQLKDFIMQAIFTSLKFLCIVLGVICLFCKGFNVTLVRPSIDFGWLGLAFIAAGLYLPI